jgi:twitching motility protein PilJ
VSVGNALVHVDQLGDTRPLSATTATYIAGLCVLLFALIMFRFNGARAQERQAQAQAELTESEIQNKVFEIEPLAEGNLSRDLTVTDGITKPIAVAINQLLDWIREVVASVNNSSLQVNEAMALSAKSSREVKSSLEEVGGIVADTASTSNELSLINNHMAELAETNRNMEDATQSLVKLTGIASDVRERFERILSLSEQTRNYMGDMRQQIEQSGNSSSRVTESVSEILERTLSTQRAADRMDSATNDLRTLFDRLREDTQRFKLSEEESASVGMDDVPTLQSDDIDSEAEIAELADVEDFELAEHKKAS